MPPPPKTNVAAWRKYCENSRNRKREQRKRAKLEKQQKAAAPWVRKHTKCLQERLDFEIQRKNVVMRRLATLQKRHDAKCSTLDDCRSERDHARLARDQAVDVAEKVVKENAMLRSLVRELNAEIKRLKHQGNAGRCSR